MKKISLSLVFLLALPSTSVLAEEVSVPTQELTPVTTAIPDGEVMDLNESETDLDPKQETNLDTNEVSGAPDSLPHDMNESNQPSISEDPNVNEQRDDNRLVTLDDQPEPALGCDANVSVACVDGIGYTSLSEAIDATPTNGSLDILKDISLTESLSDDQRYYLSINKSIVINGNNHKITVKNRGIRILGGDSKGLEINVTLNNLTIVNSEEKGRIIDTRGGHFTVNINNCHLQTSGIGNTQAITVGGNHAHMNTINISNSTIEATNAGYGIVVFNPVDLNIRQSTVTGYAALYFKGIDASAGSNGSEVKAVESTLNGVNPHTEISVSSFGTVVFEDGYINVELDNSTVTVSTSNTANHSAFTLGGNNAGGCDVVLNNNSRIELSGNKSFIVNEVLKNQKEYLKLNSVSSNASFKDIISDSQSSVRIATANRDTYYVDSIDNINTIISNTSDIATIEIVSGISELNNIPIGVKIENTSNQDITVNGEIIKSNKDSVVGIPLSEEIKNGTSNLYGENTVFFKGQFYRNLVDALNAVYMADTNTENILYCKKNADVGSMTHGHVADDITIYGNSAFVSAGERDLEFDTFKYDRVSGKQDPNGVYLDKDITVNVYDLDGIAAWGERHTDYTVNLNFVNCDAMQRIYFTNGNNKKGVVNISVDNCTFDANGKSVTGVSLPANVGTSIYSNSDGKISIKNSKFTGIHVGLNLNHKSTGTQTVEIINSEFIDCGQGDKDTKTYAAPIRIVSVTNGKSDLIIDSVRFIDTDGIQPSNGDILLGDGRKDKDAQQGITTLAMTNTNANVMVQESGYYNSDNTVNPDLGKITPITENQIVKPDIGNHFVVSDEIPVSPSTDDKKDNGTTSTWDDGGPFTTDNCGKVYDRWGNLIWSPDKCNVTSSNSYHLVNTSDK